MAQGPFAPHSALLAPAPPPPWLQVMTEGVVLNLSHFIAMLLVGT